MPLSAVHRLAPLCLHECEHSFTSLITHARIKRQAANHEGVYKPEKKKFGFFQIPYCNVTLLLAIVLAGITDNRVDFKRKGGLRLVLYPCNLAPRRALGMSIERDMFLCSFPFKAAFGLYSA